MNYENTICDAVNILVDAAVEKANYDRTIKATIVEVDKDIRGKYKVKYQDSTFYAYSTDIYIAYKEGARVYVLIPENNTSNTKTILGLADSNGDDYIPLIDPDDPGGHGNAEHRDISWESYQALSNIEKNNGTEYFVYDYPEDTDKIGDMSELKTSAKSSLVESINEIFNKEKNLEDNLTDTVKRLIEEVYQEKISDTLKGSY